MAQAGTIDQQLLSMSDQEKQEAAAKLREEKNNNEEQIEREQQAKQEMSLRQAVAAERKKQEAMARLVSSEEQAGTGTEGGSGSGLLKSKFADYVLDWVPGYNSYSYLSDLLTGRISKISPVRMILRLFAWFFSNIEIIAIIIGALAIICLIVYFQDMSAWEKIKSLWNAFNALGSDWSAVKALKELFGAIKL